MFPLVRISNKSLISFLAAIVCVVFIHPQVARAGENTPGWEWHDPTMACNGDCAVHIYGGKYLDTDLKWVFGFEGKFVPIWDYEYENSNIFAGAFSRQVVSYSDLFSVEVETGLAQRFGKMDAVEIWSAIYFRWKKFPWNDFIYTTMATSTGLNYATKIEQLDRRRGGGKASKLLHFHSPEITFSLPEHKEMELVFRIHHRSGGKEFFGPIKLFNGVTGGAQHATVGLRYRF